MTAAVPSSPWTPDSISMDKEGEPSIVTASREAATPTAISRSIRSGSSSPRRIATD